MLVGAFRLMAILVVAFVLVACQGLGGNQGQNGNTATAEETESEETPEPEDTDEPGDTDEPEETDGAEETDEPEETDDGGNGGDGGDGQEGETSVFDLEVGTCFNVADDDASSFETVPAVPCDEAHEYEVFALVEHEAGADEEYPGDDEIDEFAFEECEGEFEGYVGSDYAESIYYINYLTPSEDTWEEGDREVVCVLYDPEDDELTGSARDSEE